MLNEMHRQRATDMEIWENIVTSCAYLIGSFYSENINIFIHKFK